MSRFILPFADVGSGIKPSDGAKLFFFQTNTSTPKNTYSDEGLDAGNANTNPVIANGNGVFSDIWLEDGRYKVVLQDRSGEQIWEADPVIGDPIYNVNKVFEGVSLAVAAVTAAPVNYPNQSGVVTLSYRTKAECDALSISYPDKIGGQFTIVSSGTGSITTGEYINAGTKQLKLKVEPRIYATVADLIAETYLVLGQSISINSYTATSSSGLMFGKIVAPSTGTADGGSYINLTGSGFQFEQNFKKNTDITLFGAPDGFSVDSAAALLAAATYISNSEVGHVLTINAKHLIDSNVTIPKNVPIRGVNDLIGNPGNNTTAPFGTINSALQVNSSATITMQSNSTIGGVFIYRKGMSFPETSSAAFAGTCITVEGEDVGIFESMIMGFDLAITSDSHQRLRLRDLNLDNENCIKIENSLDIAYISRVHCWPFATIAAPTKPSDWADRGTAFDMLNTGDWTKMTDCFAYGYLRGYNLLGVNSCTLLSCSADGTTTYTNSIGFNIEGGCTDTRIIGCQSAAQFTGYRIDADAIANLPTQLIGSDSWGCINHGKLIDGGDVRIDGGIDRDVINGISINNAASKVFIDNNRISAASSLPINCMVATSNVRLGENIDFGTLAVGNSVANNNLQIKTLVSAATVSLYPDINKYKISGTTTINLVNSGWAGRRITFRLASALTFTHGSGGGSNPSAMVLKDGTNFVAAAGSTLELEHDGGLWYEVSRRS